MEYYDRQGRPIDQHEWVRLFGDPGYKLVASDELFDGTWISTVWLGLNHRFGDGPPLIFETMVFPRKGPSVAMAELLENPEAGAHWREQESRRHASEAEAIAYHDQVAAKITEALERLRDAVSAPIEGRDS